jgi:uncharacterized membrane protein
MESAKKIEPARIYALELSMSWLLRAGVFVCGGLIAFGWVAMLMQSSASLGGAPQGTALHEIALRIRGGDFRAFVPLGIRLLLLLPVLRVALSLVLFSAKRDVIYVCLSASVLMILLGSILFGLSGAG